MTWIKAEFAAGLIADETPLAAEGGYVDGNLVRFRQGRPETVGGWERLTESTYEGVVRGGKIWSNLEGAPRMAFGTQNNLYSYIGSTRTDITPRICDHQLLPENPFVLESATTKVVAVTHPGHGLEAGDSVTFVQAVNSVTGLIYFWSGTDNIPCPTILTSPCNGTFAVDTVTDTGEYKIVLTDTTGLSVGVANGGLTVTATAGAFTNGQLDAGTDPIVYPRTWSLDNFGEYLLAVPDGQKLFAGAVGDTPENILSQDNADWARTGDYGSNQYLSTMQAIKSGNMSQNISASVTAGRTYRLAFNIHIDEAQQGSANQIYIQLRVDVQTGSGLVNVIPIWTIGISVTSPYSAIDLDLPYEFGFVMPADPTDIVLYASLQKQYTSGGYVYLTPELDSFSLIEVMMAAVTEAPNYSEIMFVDPNRFVVLGGTTNAVGDYDPMLLRWSDQENYRLWIPSDTNLAGEIPLSRGGRIVGAVVTRQQNMVFTDEAAYSMQFTGSSGDVFSVTLLGAGCGLISRFGAAEYNGTVLWMSSNGNFYIFNGAIPQIVNCPVRAYVFDALNVEQQSKIYAGVNSTYNEILWFYPRLPNTECSHYVAYNFVENHWSHGEMDRTTWLAPGIFQYPIAFEPNEHLIYNQECGTLADGEQLPWSLTTSYFNIEDGDKIASLTKYIPDFERLDGQLSIRFNLKYWPASPTAIEFGPYSVTPTTTEINVRQSGRQAQIVWENGDGDDAGFARWGVQTFDVLQTGARR